jgi:hypothetical protein
MSTPKHQHHQNSDNNEEEINPDNSSKELKPMQPSIDHPKSDGDTAILPSDAIRKLRRNSGMNLKRYTDSLNAKHEIVLLIRGIVERVELQDGDKLVLGRLDGRARQRIDMDLTQYGAVDRGVSREHCSLHLEENSIFITDLGSTNGTFINSKRLDPNIPTQLHKGDELILGRLIVQVLFR